MWLGAAGIAIGTGNTPMLPRRNGDCNYVEDRMPCKPPFNPHLSAALDKLIIAMESSRPSARKPLRIVKRALEAGVPARAVR